MTNTLTAKEIMDRRQSLFFDYSQLSGADLKRLREYLEEEIAKATAAGETTTSTMKLCDKVQVSYNDDLTLRNAFYRVDSHYFEDREAISLNADGFIGKCGWSDSHNDIPFSRALERWLKTVCDRLPVIHENKE